MRDPSGDPLHILLLEDSDIDAELLTAQLDRSDIACRIARVQDRRGFVAALARDPDVVIADYSLPDFDGLSALEIVRAQRPDIPFVFVSGVVGEEFATAALRRGAADYVMKRNLIRLPAAITRAVQEARERRDLQRAEQALRDKDISVRLAMEAAELGSWRFDPETLALSWDERCQSLFQLPATPVITYAEFLSRVAAPDRAAVDAAIRAVRDPAGGEGLNIEFAVRLPDGACRWVAARGQAQHAGGKCTRLIGVLRDITEQKLLERRLRELNEALEQQVEHRTAERNRLWHLSRDMLLVCRFDGTILDINPAWEATTGWAQDDLRGRRFWDLVHQDDRDALRTEIAHMAEGDYAEVFEARCLHQDSSYRRIAWCAVPDDNMFHAVGRDITQERETAAALKTMEENLRQSQKMEAVGQLTGGIAHDFNNMLAVILGAMQMQKRRLSRGDTNVIHLVDAAIDGAQRAAALTQRLLAFSRRQSLEPELFDANAMLRSLSEMLARTLGETLRFELDPDPQPCCIRVDRHQLENAILNLAVNARDAMAQGGTLRIATGISRLDATVISHFNREPGDYVCITVSDTGSGMAPEVMEHAFEPFFTTKEVGRGTGLGLSQVYGFIKQSGGYVKMTSSVGAGTTVAMYLPRQEPAALAAAEREPLAPEIMPEGRESILVVEDEPAVRRLTVEGLRELGYTVVEAGNAAEAVDLLAHGSFDLLFTDVVMPDTNGRELALKARAQNPQLKVLFTSGYSHDAMRANGVLDHGIRLLRKPFSLEQMAQVVREVLGHRRG